MHRGGSVISFEFFITIRNIVPEHCHMWAEIVSIDEEEKMAQKEKPEAGEKTSPFLEVCQCSQ